jgi:hypothetical protein
MAEGRGSNRPRTTPAGFRDQSVKPLRHPSGTGAEPAAASVVAAAQPVSKAARPVATDHLDLDRGGPVEDVDRHVAIGAARQDVEACARHLEIPQPDPCEPGRQPRMVQRHARRIGLDLETEGGRERRRRGRDGPGLRRAGVGRGVGPAPGRPRKPQKTSGDRRGSPCAAASSGASTSATSASPRDTGASSPPDRCAPERPAGRPTGTARARPAGSPHRSRLPQRVVAEGVGFEPTEGEPSLVFKTSPLNRSGTPPAAVP